MKWIPRIFLLFEVLQCQINKNSKKEEGFSVKNLSKLV